MLLSYILSYCVSYCFTILWATSYCVIYYELRATVPWATVLWASSYKLRWYELRYHEPWVVRVRHTQWFCISLVLVALCVSIWINSWFRNWRLGLLWWWHGQLWWTCARADFRFAPSQWETSLQSNIVSHCLGASLESTCIHNNGITWYIKYPKVITVTLTKLHVIQDKISRKNFVMWKSTLS